jgi:parvulin-like peptidyl-prolyl cis-trans isomerase-like protein
MTRYGLVCLLLGALSWGQASKSNSAPWTQKGALPSATPQSTAPAAKPAAAPPADLPPNTPVITINGLCENPPADKSKVTDCKTVITRAEFEKLIEAVQPAMPAGVRKQFATNYARALVISQKAEQMGLDKEPDFEAHIRLARIQVLSQAYNKAIQQKASQISDKEIEDYYRANTAKFEQADLDRIYVSKTQQQPASEAQASAAEQQKRASDSEAAMKAEADELHNRAVAGEDFTKLQAEAYQAAGIKAVAPNAGMVKVRRTTLPRGQAGVMDLKPGEVSDVIGDQNGYYIYRMKSKQVLPLDQAREEIRDALHSERMQDEIKAVRESATPHFNESYFAPVAQPNLAAPQPDGTATPQGNDPDDK